MDTAAWLLRVVHIAAGVVALLTFWVPLVVTKGNKLHRRSGWVYVMAMYVAAATALLIVPVRLVQRPRAEWSGSIFLAYVALLAFTAAFHGVRVLKQKRRTTPHHGALELAAPWALLVSSFALELYGLQSHFVLAMAFAPVGLLVAVPQLRVLRSAPATKTWWLLAHISGMGVSCIGTLTAFLVLNARTVMPGIPPLVAWLAPTVLGIPLLSYAKRRHGGQPSGRAGSSAS